MNNVRGQLSHVRQAAQAILRELEKTGVSPDYPDIQNLTYAEAQLLVQTNPGYKMRGDEGGWHIEYAGERVYNVLPEDNSREAVVLSEPDVDEHIFPDLRY